MSAAGIEADLERVHGAWADLTEPIAGIPGVRGVTPVSWMAVAYEVDGEPVAVLLDRHRSAGGRCTPARIARSSTVAPPIRGQRTRSRSTRRAQRQMGVDVGDRITLRSYAPDQFAAFIGSDIEEDRGPRVDVVVTGIHRSAEDISDNPEAIVLLTPAFHDRYGDQIVHCDCSFWIAASRSDADGIAAALPAVIGDYPLAVQEVDGPVRTRVDRSVALEVGALQIAALSPRSRRCSSSPRPSPVTSAATDPRHRHLRRSARHDRQSSADGP